MDKQQARPRVLLWLRESLVQAEGCSVSREELYVRYLDMCQTERLESTSQSGLGRMVNQVFPGISSRRLGARNANKMHYHNLRFVVSHTGRDSPTASPGLSTSRTSSPSPSPPVSPHAPVVDPNSAMCLWPSDWTLPVGVESEPHPWSVLPLTATMDLAAFAAQQEGVQARHMAEVGGALEKFLLDGDGRPILALESFLLERQRAYPADGAVYDCLYMVAWWKRFLCADATAGRTQCAALLQHILSFPEAMESYCYQPACELLRECQQSADDVAPMLSENHVAASLARHQQVQPTTWTGLCDFVSRILLHVLKARSHVGDSDSVQLALLLHQASPLELALCLHELHNRRMLHVAVNVLRHSCPAFAGTLEDHMLQSVMGPFPGVYSCLLAAVSGCPVEPTTDRARLQ